MFTLKESTQVKLVNVQPRTEHHGEALVLALDLTFSWQTNNRALDMIHDQLRTSLFAAEKHASAEPSEDDDDDEQDEMDLPVDELPYLVFPRMKYPLKFEDEQTGITLTFVYGLGGKSNIVVNNGVQKNVQVTPIEGGSVDIKWTVSSNSDIDEKIAGKTATLQGHDVDITMLGPDPNAQPSKGKLPDLGKGDDWPFPEGKPEQPRAGDVFAEAHAAGKTTPAKKRTAKKAAKKFTRKRRA